MKGVRVNTNATATKWLAEPNHNMRDEEKMVRDGVAGDGQALSEEEESRINENAENVYGMQTELGQAQAQAQAQVLPQGQQQQPRGPQGPVVCWEQFLPIRSLKVLLVENDESTRHIVSALLRNCSYEAVAVANGLEAWKILEDLTSRIDLVLTEVVMPSLSGIGLLSKIMSHKTCKNIPVIMMSSNDSMGIVFKCLSKGAVDFLVKPIRKNELKNLWQHVWRKCHSSSGSGSESGIRTQLSTKSKSIEGSDNDTGSNDEDDNGSIGVNFRDGSDNGSGTQSSWSKRGVEDESPRHMSPWDQLVDPPDSTCGRVIYSRSKALSKKWVPAAASRECHEQEDELDSKNGPEKLEKGRLDLNSEIQNSKLRNEAADLMGAITNNASPRIESVANEVANDLSKITDIKEKAIYDAKEMPSLELSLKRLRDLGDTGTSAQNRNVLKHSDLSAFSRYNTTSTANQAPAGNVGSCSPLDNSSEAAKTESMHNLQSNSNGTPNQHSNGSSSNNDMGSTTNNVVTKPEALNDNPLPKPVASINPSSGFQLVQHSRISSLQSAIPGKADAARVNKVFAQAKAMHQQVQIQYHHYHYHLHNHHLHRMQQQQQQLSNNDGMPLRSIVAEAPHCGQSIMLSTSVEGNAANYSLNGSASGSHNGSNGENGSSTAVNAEGTNMTSDNGIHGKCGAGGGCGNGSRSGIDQNLLSQREAALHKFRQKRKERCFEKKVRYQSRKKLAEQRPRVRGQFVRQPMNINRNRDTDC